jgi:hypothetical protein
VNTTLRRVRRPGAQFAGRGLVGCAAVLALFASGCSRGEATQGWEVLPCGEVYPGFTGESAHTYECWHDVDATDLAALVESGAAQVLDEYGSDAIDRGRRCTEQSATKAGDVEVVRACGAYIDVIGSTQASVVITGVAKYTQAQLDLIEEGVDPGPFEAVVRIDRTECEIAVDVGGCVS